MAMFDFSGSFAEPDGPKLLRKVPVVDPVRDPTLDPGGGGGGAAADAEEDWATVMPDGTIWIQTARGVLTTERLSVGTYTVTRSVAFPSIDGRFAAAPLVTPLSFADEDPELEVNDQPWFTTTNPSNTRGVLAWDSVNQRVLGTDYDHDVAFAGNPDRIAIGQPDDPFPQSYLYLPTGWTNLNYDGIGDVLVIDDTFRLILVQARTNDGSAKTTLIYDLDNLTGGVIYNTFEDIGGPNNCTILGHSDDHFVLKRATDFKLYSRDGDGLPLSELGTYSSVSGIGYKDLIVDNNGLFWGPNSSSPKDWQRLPITASYVGATVDAGADGIDDRIYCFNPLDNHIYFMTNFSAAGTGDCKLKKMSCDSPFTITTLATYADSYDTDTADETLMNIVSLQFTPDFLTLIAIRGGDTANHPYLFFVGPEDGVIDGALSLPSPYSNNYGAEAIVSLPGRVLTIGSQYLQVIDYTTGSTGEGADFYPPVFGAHMMDRFTAMVMFWDPAALPAKVKIDCGFHIKFARDPGT